MIGRITDDTKIHHRRIRRILPVGADNHSIIFPCQIFLSLFLQTRFQSCTEDDDSSQERRTSRPTMRSSLSRNVRHPVRKRSRQLQERLSLLPTPPGHYSPLSSYSPNKRNNNAVTTVTRSKGLHPGN
ncbi:hypothetical protein Mapa_017309 [Marchantia paleacea]|nr:hypothetical protein Mapa_017309 [Marchantia paleacea]